jgi:hypothetical protein
VKFVKVRLSGDTAALGAALALLVSAAQSGGAEIAEQSALYPNRRDPGCRVYLTLALPGAAEPAEDQRGAAHHRQAIRRPAALTPAKESRGKRHLP